MSPDCFTGTIFVSLPDESNDDVGDHAHDWGDDQHHQELAHGSCLQITEQRKPILRFWHGRIIAEDGAPPAQPGGFCFASATARPAPGVSSAAAVKATGSC